jgi:hypothetical protein
LPKDDRVEAFAGVVREFKYVLDKDEHKAAEKRAQTAHKEFVQDPMGYGKKGKRTTVQGTRASLERRRR